MADITMRIYLTGWIGIDLTTIKSQKLKKVRSENMETQPNQPILGRMHISSFIGKLTLSKKCNRQLKFPKICYKK